MRTLARAAIILVLLGFGAVPMLRGGRPAGAEPGASTVTVPQFAVEISHWAPQNRLSEPALLLFLGVGLVVAASVLPGLVRRRVRLSHLHAADHEAEKNFPLEKADFHPNGRFRIEPSASAQAQWPERNRASDGTLG
jgi:hypothetical protein